MKNQNNIKNINHYKNNNAGEPVMDSGLCNVGLDHKWFSNL